MKPPKEKMTRKQFWTRLGLYVLFGVVLPFIFIVFRFNLFGKVTKISIGGWELVSLIFIAVFFLKLLNGVKKGLPYSLLTQIINGLVKVILPLILALIISYYFKDNMEYLSQFLCVLIVCESIAIIANPLPQWAHENKVEEEEATLKSIISAFTKKDEDSKAEK